MECPKQGQGGTFYGFGNLQPPPPPCVQQPLPSPCSSRCLSMRVASASSLCATTAASKLRVGVPPIVVTGVPTDAPSCYCWRTSSSFQRRHVFTWRTWTSSYWRAALSVCAGMRLWCCCWHVHVASSWHTTFCCQRTSSAASCASSC